MAEATRLSSRSEAPASLSTILVARSTAPAAMLDPQRRSPKKSTTLAARPWRTQTQSPLHRVVQRLFKRRWTHSERSNIVINNAGILRDKTFHNLTPESSSCAVIAVHLLGAFYVTQPAWLIMREKSYGRIINTSSNSGILGNFGQSNYGAAKMGLVGFTRVLANEGRKYNIKANAIAPVAKTRMTEELLGSFGDKLEAEEITPTVCYLAHEDCPVTGEIYSVAGGTVSRFFIGLTPGWYKNGHSVEDVRDNFEQIRNEEGYIVPAGPQDELAKLLGMLSAE